MKKQFYKEEEIPQEGAPMMYITNKCKTVGDLIKLCREFGIHKEYTQRLAQ